MLDDEPLPLGIACWRLCQYVDGAFDDNQVLLHLQRRHTKPASRCGRAGEDVPKLGDILCPCIKGVLPGLEHGKGINHFLMLGVSVMDQSNEDAGIKQILH